MADGGADIQKIGAIQLNNSPINALARAVSGGCATKSAVDNQAGQELAVAVGGEEEESHDKKGGSASRSHSEL